MDRVDKIISARGRSFAAWEIKDYLNPREWCDSPEVPKDSFDEHINADRLCSVDGKAVEGNFSEYALDLCGLWRLTSKAQGDMAAVDIDAKVPGSIHTALMEAGVTKDPYVGYEDRVAHSHSSRTWVYERDFEYSGSGKNVMLIFKGVCDRCKVFLNGVELGGHQGMFGGPEFDISNSVKQGFNTIKVVLEPALYYTNTVVFNCSDGWHYARLWPLGIWNSVKIVDMPKAFTGSPFITTLDCVKGTMDLSMPVYASAPEKYEIKVSIIPKNFNGDAYSFVMAARDKVRVTFDLPTFKLWWPNGRGEQNLYYLYAELVDKEEGTTVSVRRTSFGVRTLSCEAFPSGEDEHLYNRTVVINREGIFMKGAGWCAIDAMMRYTRADYDRILSRVKQQGVNFFRAWGGGLSETDDFYDLCDEYGICVYQEWPCCWDSHNHQPAEVLYESIRRNTIRMRNHPSLIVYGGGNEGVGSVKDEVLNKIGGITYAYDGTRDFWRQDGGVGGRGIVHDHIHWGGEKPEHYLTRYGLTDELNMHEYGLDGFMGLDSIKKFASSSDLMEWPLTKEGVISYHTATFNGYYGWSPTPYGHDVVTYLHYASMFTEPSNLNSLIMGSQLAQSYSKFPTVVNSRIKWPRCTANVYYKCNDVFPGSSWAVIDWYGAPKIAHYNCQNAHAPLMAAGLMDRYNTFDKEDKDLNVPVYLLDDNKLLDGKGWTVKVYLYNGELQTVASKTFAGKGYQGKSHYLGVFAVREELLTCNPLHIVYDFYVEDKFVSRYSMAMNFDQDQGCLFRLPKTDISMVKYDRSSDPEAFDAMEEEYYSKNYILPQCCRYNQFGTCGDKAVMIENNSDVPAVSAYIIPSESSHKFVCSENYFWLMPGEKRLVYVSDLDLACKVIAFNSEDIEAELKLVSEYEGPGDDDGFALKCISEDCHSFMLSWNKIPDVIGYTIYIDGKQKYSIPASDDCVFVCSDVEESKAYKVRVCAVDSDFKEFASSGEVEVKVLPDMEKPFPVYANMLGRNMLCVRFSKNILPQSIDKDNFSVDGCGIASVYANEGCGKEVIAVLDNSSKHKGGFMLGLKGVSDTTFNKNICDESLIKVQGAVYLSDMVSIQNPWGNDKLIGLPLTAYSIGSQATLKFKIYDDGVNEYRVILAKDTKGTPGHFEFYLRPDGELFMYSSKGDRTLCLNVGDFKDGMSVEIRCKGKVTEVYCEGRKVVTHNDGVSRVVDNGMLTLYGLNDGSLKYNGVIEDIELLTWCD